MQVISTEVFHSGLVGLDPKHLPFPTAVLKVAEAAHQDLVFEDMGGASIRLVPWPKNQTDPVWCHALLAIDHGHMLLGTACISNVSAALKLRSPGAAPL